MSGWQLARKDILNLKAYRAGEQDPGMIRLNANEAPQPIAQTGNSVSLNRYPDVHPDNLAGRMASLFSVAEDQLLVTRGSSEAIDALVRAFCRAYQDNIVAPSPSFEMYRFYADVQGADLRTVTLIAEDDFRIDPDAVLQRCDDRTRLVMLCSPNNPTGNTMRTDDVLTIAERRRDKSIVVVDEAYVEFSDQRSLASAVDDVDNIVVLRTLSKAHALAGARCGAAIACPELINVLRRVLPPYSFPTPVIESVMHVLDSAQTDESQRTIAAIVSERDRVYAAISTLPGVSYAWRSEANFILVRFVNIERTRKLLSEARILVRDFSDEAGLSGCVRITIGSRAENDALLAALAAIEHAGDDA